MSFVDINSMSENASIQTDSQIVSEANSMALEDSAPEKDGEATDFNKNLIVSMIQEEFEKSRTRRLPEEQRWIESYRNFRGIYGPSTQFTDTEKSKAFIKITKTKVLAAYAQVVDVLFAGNKFPIGVTPLKIPLSVEDAVNFDPKAPPTQAPTDQPQSLKTVPSMSPEMVKIFGPKKDLLNKVSDKLQSGVGQTPSSITYQPNQEAANKMDKKIQDQLDEAEANKSLRSTVFEMCLFGTGIYKGPFVTSKDYPKWDESGAYTPIQKIIPDMEFVSIWDSYPDADARNMKECEDFIQRHRMSRTQLRALTKRPYFRKKSIEKLILDGPNYVAQYWETQLRDNQIFITHDRWEVLEYWGMIDKDLAKEYGLKIPKEYKDFDEVQVNCWVSGDYILRLVINPFTPSRIPYHAVPYEVNPYSFFGVGVAENMLDSQLLMNGFMRMAVDNAALSSNIIFEVNEDLLAPGQNFSLHPGKVFRRIGGQVGQAIHSEKIENVTQECLMLFDKARQLSDESTGMPSYAHGMTDVMSTGKTASGMSMLMGAAAQNIKAVVRNVDDYLLQPLGMDLFAFNMQFNFDQDYIGDCTIVAKGTESLMRNEVRSQRLLQLAQFAAGNQAMQPYIKWDYILREYAASLDLDEEEVVNDPRAAAIQAMDMAKMQQLMGGPAAGGQPAQDAQQGQAQANGQVQGASIPNPNDPTGNGDGNIVPGASPEPNNPGFSGSSNG